MKRSLRTLVWLLCIVVSGSEVQAADGMFGWRRNNSTGYCEKPADRQCNIEKRGWCGKRKGDCYGASRAVTSVADAREQLLKYFSGQKLSVAAVAEKRWRFEADVLDSRGKVVDRVMIDKRSGRVRSIY